MATKTFDSLYENLLNELSPVDAEYGSWSNSLETSIDTAPGGGYLIGKIATALDTSKEEVVKMISQKLYDKVFPEGTSPANNEEAFRSYITAALQEIVANLQEEEGIKIPGAGKAVAGYTARVISQLGDAKKEFGARVSKKELEDAVVNAEDSEVENGKPEVTRAPKAPRYIATAEYEISTLEEMKAAGIELSEDLMTYYGRIENIADRVQTGEDIVKAIQRGGTESTTALRATSALIRAGVIKYASAEDSDQDIEALTAGEEDMEEVGRKEFERSFSATYKDAMASEPKAMSYNFED